MITTARPDPVPGAGHEPNTLNARAIVGFAVVLVIVGAITHVAVFELQGVLQRAHESSDSSTPPPVSGFSSAEHWITPGEDLAELRAREDERLNASGWDQTHTRARIPIDEAMKLYVERAHAPQAHPQSGAIPPR